jgi:hypothetical protein
MMTKLKWMSLRVLLQELLMQFFSFGAWRDYLTTGKHLITPISAHLFGVSTLQERW